MKLEQMLYGLGKEHETCKAFDAGEMEMSPDLKNTEVNPLPSAGPAGLQGNIKRMLEIHD